MSMSGPIRTTDWAAYQSKQPDNSPYVHKPAHFIISPGMGIEHRALALSTISILSGNSKVFDLFIWIDNTNGAEIVSKQSGFQWNTHTRAEKTIKLFGMCISLNSNWLHYLNFPSTADQALLLLIGFSQARLQKKMFTVENIHIGIHIFVWISYVTQSIRKWWTFFKQILLCDINIFTYFANI